MAVRVVFTSRFNSARSQMAEGFLRELGALSSTSTVPDPPRSVSTRALSW